MSGQPTQPSRVEDRFEIRGRLGLGGMGVVFEAYDRLRDMRVALKVLREPTPDTIYRFKREFRTLSDLTHRNLVTLYELLFVGEQWMFTMELVDGSDFMSYVRGRNETAPTEEDTLRVGAPGSATTGAAPARQPSESASPPIDQARLAEALAQLVDGIEALHAAHVLHRDIKPSNVLVDQQGRVVLLDFGVIASERIDQHQTSEQAIVGTPAYMSPEQLRGVGELTAASDWYSVGLTLYQVLTGRRPFSGSPEGVLRAKESEDFASPKSINADVPDDLDRICVALLRADATRRAGGADIRRALRRAAGTASAIAARPSSAPLGRAAELAAMREQLADVGRSGRGAALLVHGSSGVGKTSLAEAFLDELAADPATVVLAGRCYQQERLPFKGVDSLVDSLTHFLGSLPRDDAEAILPMEISALCHLFPVLRRVAAVAESPPGLQALADPREVRERGSQALRELLQRIGAAWRLVLFIDDLQWGDRDSAALLMSVMRAPAPPLLLLGTYRSEESDTSELLVQLLGGQHELATTTLELLPLVPEQSIELARQRLGASGDAERVALIANESGGNPYFIHELAELMRSQSNAVSSFGRGQLTLDEMIAARARALPTEARQLLELVALAGRPIAAEVLAAAHGAILSADTIKLLRAQHLVRLRGVPGHERIEPYHDRIRESLAARIDPAVARSYHAALASALAGSEAPEHEAIAGHFEGAGDRAQASRHYTHAAEHAARALAFDHAAQLYRKALELSPTADAGVHAGLQERLGDALANAGRGNDAAAAFLAAVDGAGSDEALRVRCRKRAAEELLRSGSIDTGLDELGRALGAVGLTLPRLPLARLLWLRARVRLRGLGAKRRGTRELALDERNRLDLCWSAATSLAMTDHMKGAVFQTQHLLLALAAGDPAHLSRGYCLEAVFRSLDGVKARASTQAILALAMRVAEEAGDSATRAIAIGAGGASAYALADFKSAREQCDRAVQLLRRETVGDWFLLNTFELYALWALAYLGEMDELSSRVPRLLRETEARGDRYMTACLCTDLPALAWLARDDAQTGLEALRDAMRRWPATDAYHVQHWSALQAEINSDIYTGRGGAAWELAQRGWPALRRSLLLTMQIVRIEALNVWARAALAAAAAGVDRDEALRAAEDSARRLEKESMTHGPALAALQRAAVSAQRGTQPDAADWLDRAVTGFRRADMTVHAAVALRRRGMLVAGDEGARLIAEADRVLSAQQIARPDRFADLLAPGFPI